MWITSKNATLSEGTHSSANTKSRPNGANGSTWRLIRYDSQGSITP